MSQDIFGVYGASGCGRSLMPIARQMLNDAGIALDRLYFIDDKDFGVIINDHKVMSFDGFLGVSAKKRYVVIAIANSKIREQLSEKLKKHDVYTWTLVSSKTLIMDNVSLGEGAALSPFVTLTSNIRIGRYFHANLYSYVEHDCVIGDYVTFAPRVNCNGNVVIEDHAYIGTGAIIKQGTPDQPIVIGRGAIVGMGAVVTKSVPAGVTVIGNPARILEPKS
jgi:sugar O-acyltransferase (sialic acid O-acetyltransferase NeuD family)